MATRPELRERSQRRPRILAAVLSANRAVLRRQAMLNSARAADAEDALQDAYFAFLRYYEGPPGEPALRYLMVVVKHSAWELARRARRETLYSPELSTTDELDRERRLLRVPCDRPGPAEHAERSRRASEFFADLDELKRDQRTALLLLGLGYSYAEIQENRGWTRAKVNRCLAEGRAALRAREREQR